MFTIKRRRYPIILLGLFLYSNALADDGNSKPIRSNDIYNQTGSNGYTDEQGVSYYSTCPEKGRGIAYVSNCKSTGGTIVIPSVIDFSVYQQPGAPGGFDGWSVDARTRGDDNEKDNYKYYTSDVKCLGLNAFSGNVNIISVELPNSITTIEYECFQGCKNLTTVKFGKNVKWVYDDIFSGCKSLKNVYLGESILTIPTDMFLGCESLESIEIPNSVEKIDYESFAGCSSLTDIKIPNSVVEISYNAFRNCTSLAKIKLPNSISSIGAIFTGCSNLIEVNIPIAVTFIPSATFKGCSSLPSIVIPKNVNRIGKNAFSGCNSLMDVYSEIEEPFDIPEDTFDEYTYNNAVLHVPQGTKRKYLKCSGWPKFKNIHEIGEYDMTQLIVTVNVSDGGKVIFRDTEVRNDSKEFNVLTFFGHDLMFDIIPDEGYHIKSVIRNDKDVTDKLENEEGIDRYIQYEALNGMTLSVVFEKDSQEIAHDVFTARTPSGIEMTFTVLDVDQKLVQVGTGVQGQPAIATSDISDLIIPEEINGYKVVAVGEYAFAGFTNLRSVSIPWTTNFKVLIEEPGIHVEIHSMWVRDYAFSGCSNLTAVTLYGDIGPNPVDYYLPYIDYIVFEPNIYKNATLFVPRGYKEVFQSRASWAWCEFQNIEELTDEKPVEPDGDEKPDNPEVHGSFIEYFIDKDPGYGRASIMGQSDVDNQMEIDLDNVKPGAHILYVRSRDDQGRWSATVSRPLYVRQPVSIFALEYFFDNDDPEKGKGVQVVPPTDSSKPYEFEVSLGNLPVGEHRLNVRVKGNDGIWTALSSGVFTLVENTGINELDTYREPSITYTLNGFKGKGAKGVNIVQYKDGTIKKVLIK